MAFVLVLALSTSACDGLPGGGSSGAADCSSQIKSDGAVFSSHGYTDHSGSEYGAALEAECEDVGENARGSVFIDKSRRVTTYRFVGYPPAQVLGVRYSQVEGYAVFVADSVSRKDRDRIYQELDQPER